MKSAEQWLDDYKAYCEGETCRLGDDAWLSLMRDFIGYIQKDALAVCVPLDKYFTLAIEQAESIGYVHPDIDTQNMVECLRATSTLLARVKALEAGLAIAAEAMQRVDDQGEEIAYVVMDALPLARNLLTQGEKG